jgi:hypothetical protein
MLPAPDLRPDRFGALLSLAAHTRRFWKWGGLVVVAGVLVGLAVSSLRKPIYRSEAIIQYRQNTNLDAVREKLLERNRLHKIIEDFRLYPEIVGARGDVEAVDELRLHVQLRPLEGDIFGLSFEGDRPDQVEQVAVRLTAAVIADNTIKAPVIEATPKKEPDEELKRKQAALARFVAAHPEFGGEAPVLRPPEKKATTPAPARPPDVTLLALEREAQRVRERLKPRKAPESEPKNPTEVSGLSTTPGDLKMPTWAQDPKPEPKKEPEKEPEKEKDTIDRAALQVQLDKLNQQIAVHRARRAGQKAPAPEPAAGARSIVALETEFERLRQEVDEARARSERSRPSAPQPTAATVDRPQMSIFEAAYKPTRPINAQPALYAGMGFWISLFIALVFVLASALLDDRIYTARDLARLQPPLLAVVENPRRRRLGKAMHG